MTVILNVPNNDNYWIICTCNQCGKTFPLYRPPSTKNLPDRKYCSIYCERTAELIERYKGIVITNDEIKHYLNEWPTSLTGLIYSVYVKCLDLGHPINYDNARQAVYIFFYHKLLHNKKRYGHVENLPRYTFFNDYSVMLAVRHVVDFTYKSQRNIYDYKRTDTIKYDSNGCEYDSMDYILNTDGINKYDIDRLMDIKKCLKLMIDVANSNNYAKKSLYYPLLSELYGFTPEDVAKYYPQVFKNKGDVNNSTKRYKKYFLLHNEIVKILNNYNYDTKNKDSQEDENLLRTYLGKKAKCRLCGEDFYYFSAGNKEFCKDHGYIWDKAYNSLRESQEFREKFNCTEPTHQQVFWHLINKFGPENELIKTIAKNFNYDVRGYEKECPLCGEKFYTTMTLTKSKSLGLHVCDKCRPAYPQLFKTYQSWREKGKLPFISVELDNKTVDFFLQNENLKIWKQYPEFKQRLINAKKKILLPC